MAKQPLVSVIVNNYNYGRFLREAIESVLNQTHQRIETIVVDDGSTDNSREIIAGYGDRIIPVLKANGGQNSAFEAGFAASSGSIICFLDADDTFLPTKVGRIVEEFENHPNIGSCFHALQAVDEASGELPWPDMVLAGEYDFRPGIKEGTMPLINTASSALCFQRSLIEQIIPVPNPISLNSDMYIKWTAVALSPTLYLNERLTLQRIHSRNWYTFTADDALKAKKIAREGIVSACWMRERFPRILGRWADKVFAVGLGNYWRSGAAEQELHRYIRAYLSSVPPLTRLKITVAALCVRLGLEDLLRIALHAVRPSRYGSGTSFRLSNASDHPSHPEGHTWTR
jgi:glycosyltransferase involved in cell wall biosynthesis